MQDRVGPSTVSRMYHNLPDVLFVSNMHDAARSQSFLLQHVEIDCDRRDVFILSNLGNSSTRVVLYSLVKASTDLSISRCSEVVPMSVDRRLE